MTYNIEDYQNLVELLRQALLYYADKKHYDVSHNVNGELYSSIELDSGIQARFALSRLEEFNKLIDEVKEVEELEDNLKELLKNEPNGSAFIKIIENYQKMQRIKGNDKAI
jgi:DNA-directed RNA polymerase subunit L